MMKTIFSRSFLRLNFAEIMHQLRDPGEADAGLRSRGAVRPALPHLAPRHLAALRELHHAPHRHEHHPTHDEGTELGEVFAFDP